MSVLLWQSKSASEILSQIQYLRVHEGIKNFFVAELWIQISNWVLTGLRWWVSTLTFHVVSLKRRNTSTLGATLPWNFAHLQWIHLVNKRATVRMSCFWLEGYPAGTQNGTQLIHNPAGVSNNFKPQRHAEAGARPFMSNRAMDHKTQPPGDPVHATGMFTLTLSIIYCERRIGMNDRYNASIYPTKYNRIVCFSLYCRWFYKGSSLKSRLSTEGGGSAQWALSVRSQIKHRREHSMSAHRAP